MVTTNFFIGSSVEDIFDVCGVLRPSQYSFNKILQYGQQYSRQVCSFYILGHAMTTILHLAHTEEGGAFIIRKYTDFVFSLPNVLILHKLYVQQRLQSVYRQRCELVAIAVVRSTRGRWFGFPVLLFLLFSSVFPFFTF